MTPYGEATADLMRKFYQTLSEKDRSDMRPSRRRNWATEASRTSPRCWDVRRVR